MIKYNNEIEKILYEEYGEILYKKDRQIEELNREIRRLNNRLKRKGDGEEFLNNAKILEIKLSELCTMENLDSNVEKIAKDVLYELRN